MKFEFDKKKSAANKDKNEKLISAFAKAYQWHLPLKKEKFTSLAEICKKEKVGLTYASRVYRLNFVAPQIVEAIINGT
jgi:hypothetical protein